MSQFSQRGLKDRMPFSARGFLQAVPVELEDVTATIVCEVFPSVLKRCGALNLLKVPHLILVPARPRSEAALAHCVLKPSLLGEFSNRGLLDRFFCLYSALDQLNAGQWMPEDKNFGITTGASEQDRDGFGFGHCSGCEPRMLL